MIDEQYEELKNLCFHKHRADISRIPLGNGGELISIPNVKIGEDWNHPEVTVLFMVPPGYPGAKPDCFWVQPTGLRLKGGGTPQNTNDSNPIPGDTHPGRPTTWFSWHLQSWDPNKDSLITFYKCIMQRMTPAR